MKRAMKRRSVSPRPVRCVIVNERGKIEVEAWRYPMARYYNEVYVRAKGQSGDYATFRLIVPNSRRRSHERG